MLRVTDCYLIVLPYDYSISFHCSSPWRANKLVGPGASPMKNLGLCARLFISEAPGPAFFGDF